MVFSSLMKAYVPNNYLNKGNNKNIYFLHIQCLKNNQYFQKFVIHLSEP